MALRVTAFRCQKQAFAGRLRESAPKLLNRVALSLAAQRLYAQDVTALAFDLVLVMAVEGKSSLFVEVGSLLRI